MFYTADGGYSSSGSTGSKATETENEAKKDHIPFTLTHSVKKNLIFAIEGHQGKVKTGLCKDYEVEIKIHKEQGEITITGKKERCEDALVAIKSIVSELEKVIADFDSDWSVK